MKLREVLKRINTLSNMKEEEKLYFSNKSGYILKDGKLFRFDENKKKVYRPRYTKEEFIDIQYNMAISILIGIEMVHKLLGHIPSIPTINFYDSDIVSNTEYYPDKTLKYNSTFIKTMIGDRLFLITYWQSDIHGYELRMFDINIEDYHMTLHILKGNKLDDIMDYYNRSGNLSKQSILVVDREINGENMQSTLNTSCDMYFDDCNSYDDMIESTKKTRKIKIEKLDNNNLNSLNIK